MEQQLEPGEPWYKKTPTLLMAGLLVLIVPPMAAIFPISNYCSLPIQESGQQTYSETPEIQPKTYTAAKNQPDRLSSIVKAPESISQSQKSQYAADKANKPEHSWWHTFLCDLKITDVLLATFTYWLSIVTAGLIYTGIRQEAWMRRSYKAAAYANTVAQNALNVTQDTAQRQLRAYVSVESAAISGGLSDGQVPEAIIVVKNYGQTPAYELTGDGGIALGISFETLPPPIRTLGRTKASLAPGAATKHFAFHPNKPLEVGTMDALRNGQATLWVYGELRYTDAFKTKRITKYRFQLGGIVGVRGNNLAICEEGNEER